MSGWADFAVVLGAATASLLGLLFVAVSIRVEAIAKSAELRNRSAQTMTLLLTGVLVAVLLAVAGVVLILDHKYGLYFLIPAVIAVLIGGVVNAWLILVRLTD